MLQQQARFDRWQREYNDERPHQTLAMRVPADLYMSSEQRYRGLSALDYPLHDWATTLTHYGRLCFKARKVNLSQAFAGHQVGVRQTDERIWLVTFMDYDLGYFDDETCRSRSKTPSAEPVTHASE